MTIPKIFSLLKGSILAIALFLLCLSMPSYAAEEKYVIIDGVEYTLFSNNTAWAGLVGLILDTSNGADYSEVTVHNEITYEGKTYKVMHFDYGHDVNGEIEGMIIREPGRYLSYYQKNLKKLTIEEGILLLHTGFSNYMALEEVVFEDPKDAEECGLYFYNCPNLKDIYIPANVDVIPRLRECPNTKVTFAPDHPKYKVVDGDIYSKDGKILYDVPNGSRNYKVKKSVRKIAHYAFYGNDNIKNIKMTSSVKKIDMYAFGDMKNLKSVKLSKNLDVAQQYLFRRCTNLKTVTFPKKVRKIWGGFGLSGLKKVYIKAKKLKRIEVNGLSKTCKVYVKNNTVRNQVRAAGFKGQIIVQ